jgi:hypothetical protein
MSGSAILRFDELERRVDQTAVAFRSNHPFPHLVLEDLVEADVLDALDDAYPDPSWDGWTSVDHENQRFKSSCDDLMAIPEPLFRLISELSSGRFIRWLENVTGIEQLLPDPHLAGGGLHMTREGGWLTPHTDFHVGNMSHYYRRLNLLIYLNKDWEEHNGGGLELWDLEQDALVHRVWPELGTTVIFLTDAQSVHGFSTPVAGRVRRSVALYYYTTEEPTVYSGDRLTYWRPRYERSIGARPRLARMVQLTLLSVSRVLSRGAWVTGGIGSRLSRFTTPPNDRS